MKCEIIRDLLPSYVDGLTSEESNREIMAHVAECAPCKEILEQMQEEVQEKAPKEKRKINPFRKFNRRMRRAVAMAVVIWRGRLWIQGVCEGLCHQPQRDYDGTDTGWRYALSEFRGEGRGAGA